MLNSLKSMLLLGALSLVAFPPFLYASNFQAISNQQEEGNESNKRKNSSFEKQEDSEASPKKRVKSEKESLFVLLPDELVELILDYLQSPSFQRMGLTCRRHYAITKNMTAREYSKLGDIMHIKSWLDQETSLYDIGLILSRHLKACEKLYKLVPKDIISDFNFDSEASEEKLTSFFKEQRPYLFALCLSSQLGYQEAIACTRTLTNIISANHLENLALNFGFFIDLFQVDDEDITRENLANLTLKLKFNELKEMLASIESGKAIINGDALRNEYWRNFKHPKGCSKMSKKYEFVWEFYIKSKENQKISLWLLKHIAYLKIKIPELKKEMEKQLEKNKSIYRCGVYGDPAITKRMSIYKSKLAKICTHASNAYASAVEFIPSEEDEKQRWLMESIKLLEQNIKDFKSKDYKIAGNIYERMAHFLTKQEEKVTYYKQAIFYLEKNLKSLKAEAIPEDYEDIAALYVSVAENSPEPKEKSACYEKAADYSVEELKIMEEEEISSGDYKAISGFYASAAKASEDPMKKSACYKKAADYLVEEVTTMKEGMNSKDFKKISDLYALANTARVEAERNRYEAKS